LQNQTNTIIARKFDGRIHRSWSCRLIEKKESQITFIGEFEKEIIHNELGVIRPKTLSYEFYWTDRFYNVFRFHEPDGNLRNFYCNINLPPTFNNGVLDYVDLDIDVLVWKNFEYKILDLEEFEHHSKKFLYPIEIIEKAKSALNELLELIDKRSFPFDYVEPIS
jgi:uncharacterized protein